MQDTEIHSGIFCLMKDKYQDIVWIGTDGQGVYMYYDQSAAFEANVIVVLLFDDGRNFSACFDFCFEICNKVLLLISEVIFIE